MHVKSIYQKLNELLEHILRLTLHHWPSQVLVEKKTIWNLLFFHKIKRLMWFHTCAEQIHSQQNVPATGGVL